MKVQNASELRPEGLNVLLYGDSGVGKTTALATAPGPVIVCDVEGGSLPLVGSKVGIVKVTDYAEVKEVYSAIKGGGLECATICLDSITELYKVIMDSVIKENPNVSRAYTDQASMSDYGRATELMRRLIRAFRDLPCNLIMTALAQDVKDEETGSVARIPSLPGKLAYEVAGYMDVVGYVFAKADEDGKGIKRGIAVQPAGKVIAKDRSGKLSPIEVPDIGAWVKKIAANDKGGKK